MMVLLSFVISPAALPLPQLPPFVQPLTRFSFLRWAMEAGYLLEIKHWAPLYDISSSVAFMGYDDANIPFALWFMLGFGVLMRVAMVVVFVHVVPRRGRA